MFCPCLGGWVGGGTSYAYSSFVFEFFIYRGTADSLPLYGRAYRTNLQQNCQSGEKKICKETKQKWTTTATNWNIGNNNQAAKQTNE